jgi:hypothetical protein
MELNPRKTWLERRSLGAEGVSDAVDTFPGGDEWDDLVAFGVAISGRSVPTFVTLRSAHRPGSSEDFRTWNSSFARS